MIRKMAIPSALIIILLILEIWLRTGLLGFPMGFLSYRLLLAVKEYFINKASRKMWSSFTNSNLTNKTKTK